MSEKFFVGSRLRQLRTEHDLSQSRMSEIIEISNSYLNLLESNQRPLSISVLMKINEKFDIDIKEFTRDHSPGNSQSVISCPFGPNKHQYANDKTRDN